MMQTPFIALTQLVLWYDSTRIQTWPAMLSRADETTVYRSTRSFGAEFYTDRKTTSGHSAADNTTKNLPGLEQKKDAILLRGVGFLERVDGGYQLSGIGKELADSYRDDPKGVDWVCLLGKALLTREPRTRVFMRLLSDEGAALYFAADEWWGGSIGRATISLSDGEQILPFVDNETSSHLRTAIDADPAWALGTWHADVAELTSARNHSPQGSVSGDGATRSEDVKSCDTATEAASHKPFCNSTIAFMGQTGKPYSLHAISTALRASCEVFLHLGVLECHNDCAQLDQVRAVECFGTAIAKDFGWSIQPEDAVDLADVLAETLPALATESGFVVAAELRHQLLEKGFENPDREIAQLEADGKLVISETGYGHSRHGIGLYDDQSKQLIKIRLN